MKQGLTYFSFLLIGFTLGIFYPMLLGRCQRPPHVKHTANHFAENKRGPVPDPSNRFIKKLSKHLDLNAEQKASAFKIFSTQHAKLEEIRKKTLPQFRAIKKDTKTAIRKILNEEQKNIFDEKIKNKNFLGRRPREKKTKKRR